MRQPGVNDQTGKREDLRLKFLGEILDVQPANVASSRIGYADTRAVAFLDGSMTRFTNHCRLQFAQIIGADDRGRRW